MAGETGYGSKIAYSATVDGTFVELSTIIYSITPPETETAQIEATPLQAANRHKRYLFGLKDSKEAGVEIEYDPAVYATVVGLRGLKKFWKITVGESEATLTGEGAIVNDSIGELGNDDANTISISIKPTGEWTFDAA